MEKKYEGIVVEESLEDNTIVNSLNVLKVKISDDANPSDRWHLYTVQVSKEDIDNLSKSVKRGWYMHFWKDRKVIAIYKDKQFAFDYDDKSTWQEAIDYGLSIGIPEEQLDFPIE